MVAFTKIPKQYFTLLNMTKKAFKEIYQTELKNARILRKHSLETVAQVLQNAKVSFEQKKAQEQLRQEQLRQEEQRKQIEALIKTSHDSFEQSLTKMYDDMILAFNEMHESFTTTKQEIENQTKLVTKTLWLTLYKQVHETEKHIVKDSLGNKFNYWGQRNVLRTITLPANLNIIVDQFVSIYENKYFISKIIEGLNTLYPNASALQSTYITGVEIHGFYDSKEIFDEMFDTNTKIIDVKVKADNKLLISNKYVKYSINPTAKTFDELVNGDTYCDYIKKHFKPNSCMLTGVINFCHDKLAKSEKYADELTYKRMCKICGVEYNKEGNMAMSIREATKLFEYYKWCCYFFTADMKLIHQYIPEKKNKNVSISFYAVYHNEHIYVINSNFHAISQLVQACNRAGENTEEALLTSITPPKNTFNILSQRDLQNNSIAFINSVDEITSHVQKMESSENDVLLTFITQDIERLFVQASASMKYTFQVYMNHDSLYRFKFEGLKSTNDKNLTIIVESCNDMVDDTPISDITSLDQFIRRKTLYTNLYSQIICPRLLNNFHSSVLKAHNLFPIIPCHGNIDLPIDKDNDMIPIAIDKNKAYAYELTMLRQVPVIDTFCVYRKYTNQEIKDDSLYIVSTKPNIPHLFKILFTTKLTCARMFGFTCKLIMEACKKMNIEQIFTIHYYLDPIRIEKCNFKKDVQKIYDDDLITKEQKKDLINIVIGCTGTKKNTRTKTFVTDFEDDANRFMTRYAKDHKDDPEGRNFQITRPKVILDKSCKKAVYIVNISKSCNLVNGFTILNDMIVQKSNCTMFKKAFELETLGRHVIGVKTDCLYLESSIKRDTYGEYLWEGVNLLDKEQAEKVHQEDKRNKFDILKHDPKDYGYDGERETICNIMKFDNNIDGWKILLGGHSMKPHELEQIDMITMPDFSKYKEIDISEAENKYWEPTKNSTTWNQARFNTIAREKIAMCNEPILVTAEYAGCGKSTLCINFEKDKTKTLIISPRNVLISDFIKKGYQAISLNQFLRIGYGGMVNQNTSKSAKYINELNIPENIQVVVFDELFMNDRWIRTKIYGWMEANKGKYRIFANGDLDQLKSINERDTSNNDFFESINIMFPVRINLKVIKRLANEEDRKLMVSLKKDIFNTDPSEYYNLLVNKYKFRTTHDEIAKINERIKKQNAENGENRNLKNPDLRTTTKKNICFYRRTRDTVNHFVYYNMLRRTPKQTFSETFVVGDEIISKKYISYKRDDGNEKSGRIKSNNRFKITEIKKVGKSLSFQIENVNNDDVYQEIHTLPKKTIDDHFALVFTTTVDSVQGMTIDEEYTIHDLGSPYMTAEMLNVMITRTVDFRKIIIKKMSEAERQRLEKGKEIRLYLENKINSYLESDKEKNRTCNDMITVDWFLTNLKKCQYSCPNCNCNLYFPHDDDENIGNITADRIINQEKGHEKDNCRILCVSCNVAKSDME